MRRLGLPLIAAMALTAFPAAAFERMQGCFAARDACPATRSIRRASNPGEVRLEAGKVYQLLGANKVAATHFQVRVDGASPPERWVPIGCGDEVEACEGVAGPAQPADPTTPPRGARSADNLLAISWQPAFCETHEDKVECANQAPGRFDATNLALHGLWPQPRSKAYCGVPAALQAADEARRWSRLPAVEVDAETRAALAEAMPGTQSHLDRHEWIKHGTCYGTTADVYYDDTLRLLREVNASPVRELLASRIGERVTLEELRAAFDEGFGAGAGERVEMDCEGRGRSALIVELRLNLMGEVGAAASLGALLRAADPAPESCTIGRVDAVGFEPEN